MEEKVKKNWFKSFLIFIIVCMAFLVIITIIMKGDFGKYLFENIDKRMDIIGTMFTNSVSFASALVTIMLATIAIRYADNQTRREFKDVIQERISLIEKANSEIINATKSLKFIANSSIKEIKDSNIGVINYEQISTQLKIELEKTKIPLNIFAKSIKVLEFDPIVRQHYLNKKSIKKFKNKDFYKKYESDFNGLIFDPEKVVEIALQMENKYIEGLPAEKLWNHMSYKSDLHEFTEEEKEWVYFSIILGYSTGLCETKEGKSLLVGAISILDILINLPSTIDIINFSEEFDKDIDEKTRKEVINILTGAEYSSNNFREELTKIQKKLINHFEDILSNESKHTLKIDSILEIAKGLAIKYNSPRIEANHIFNALRYVNLSAFASDIFSKMMGEHYHRIVKALGGNEFIEIARNNSDVPFDNNMELFITEAKKHLKNKDICSIR